MIECYKWGLRNHPSRNMEDSSAESKMDCGGPAQEVSEEMNIRNHS